MRYTVLDLKTGEELFKTDDYDTADDYVNLVKDIYGYSDIELIKE